MTPSSSGRPVPAMGGGRRGGHLRALRRDPIGFYCRAFATCGDAVRLELGPVTGITLFHPDAIKRVLLDNHHNYGKQTRGYIELRHVLGAGLLTSEGEHWLRQRRIAQPAFHRRHIAAFAETMVREASRWIPRWAADADGGEVVDVAGHMMELTLRVVGHTLLSTDLSNDTHRVGTALTAVIHETQRRIGTPLLDLVRHLPLPSNRRFEAALATLDDVVQRIIAERRRMSDRPRDLLSLFMEATDAETGGQMDDRQLRDEVMTMLLAGHETTAVALSWTWMLLSRHPDVRRRVEAELDEVLGGDHPTAAAYHQLPTLSRVIAESLRLFPPAWIVTRSAREEDVVMGYRIPRGAFVFMLPYVTHRHPEFWANPEGFDPDRFEDPRRGHAHRFAYFPFLGGPRQCIGKDFALMELHMVLATLAQHFRLDLAPGARPGLDPAITLRPAGGLPMTIHRRRVGG